MKEQTFKAKVETLFRAAMKEGYVHAVGRGGRAVNSANAPDLHA